jgi:hypothetical protein
VGKGVSNCGVNNVSGGKSKDDPYYKPLFKPSKSYPKPPIQIPPTRVPRNAKRLVLPHKVMKKILQKGKHSPIFWYDCDGCGNLFPSKRKRRHPAVFCDDPECLKKHRQHRFGGKPNSPEQGRKHSRHLKKKYKDPEFRKRMRRIHRDPELNRRRSEAHKKLWAKKKRKRDSVDEDIERFYMSSDWRKQTKRVQKRDNHACQACGEARPKAKRLSGHHVYALRAWIEDGNSPEDYPDELVKTLCNKCHPSTDAQQGNWRPPRAPS